MRARASAGVERGCGTREEGGVYLETGLSEFGIDLSNFIPDPPNRFDMDLKRGQEIRTRSDQTSHVFDWVGESGYPTASDVVEEIQSHGASRRTSEHLEFDRLSPDSRMILVHRRAVCTSLEEAWHLETLLRLREMPQYRRKCMLHRRTDGEKHHLDAPESPCTRHWYLDAGWDRTLAQYSFDLSGEPETDREARARKYFRIQEDPKQYWFYRNLEKKDRYYLRLGIRKFTSDTSYKTVGAPRSESGSGPVQLEWSPGIIATLPITNVTVVESSDDGHTQTVERLKQKSRVPISVSES